MRGRALVAAAVVTLEVAVPAVADPRLVLTHEPPPRTLRMRRPVAQAPAPTSAPAPRTPMPAAPPSQIRYTAPAEEQVAALRDLSQKLSFSLDLGYQVEAANPSGKASLDARAPVVGRDYAALRSYGFGELFASSRGFGVSSLATYFAIRFQATRELAYQPNPGSEQTVPVAPPIATWFERSGIEQRVGWGELKDFLPRRWGLSKLRLRLGNQHVYGPWVLHLDGAMVAYDGPLLQASTYTGVRHSDYTREQSNRRPNVFGASLRFDLRKLPTPVPIAVQGEFLALGESLVAEQPAAQSTLLQGDWRPRRDVAMIAQVRWLDGHAASQRLEIRTRYKQVTNLVLDLIRRTEHDWRWDPALTTPDADASTARRYLDLGPVVPRFVGSLRAGTLIAENVDLYVRGAFAANVTNDPEDTRNSFAAPYTELGGALEIRLRRQVALGASMLTRDTRHEALPEPVVDMMGVIQALPANEYRGEDGFTEAGTSLKLTLGARQFSSVVELYGRRTRYAVLYVDPILPVLTTDVRLGGRVTLDAWVGRNLRLFAAYDSSSAIDQAPQINAYRSLRLMMSGVY